MISSSIQKFRRQPRTAFIVCEAGSDIKSLANILDGLHVEVLNFKDAVVTSTLLQSTRELIDDADMVIAVLDRSSSINVHLELGIAIGLQKPAVVIGPDVDIPMDLNRIFWIRASLNDQAAITFQLGAYISNLQFKTSKRASKGPMHYTNVGQTSKIISPRTAGSDLEASLLEAFQRSPEIMTIVQEPRFEGYKSYIPDFAIWTTESPTTVDGPIIIEVKGDIFWGSDYQHAINRLREYAIAADVQSGLLLIDHPGENKMTVSYLFPFIVSLSVEECRHLLDNGRLVDTMRRERNRFAHSAA